MDDKDFYIFGLPVQTEFGEIRFLTYLEYLQNLSELSAMSQNVLHIYYQYKNHYDRMKLDEDTKKEIEESLDALKNESLLDIVMNRDDLEVAYRKIFNLVIADKKVVNMILSDEDMFMTYRKLVLDMNMMTESLVSPNPEIQKGYERSKRAKVSANQDKQSFGDIISIIVVGAGILPQDVARMTVLQVYSTYFRISRFQNYTTTTLFATVSEKVQIESWAAHVNMWEQDSHAIEYSKFKNTTGNMLND